MALVAKAFANAMMAITEANASIQQPCLGMIASQVRVCTHPTTLLIPLFLSAKTIALATVPMKCSMVVVLVSMLQISQCRHRGVARLTIHSSVLKQVHATPLAKLPMLHARLPQLLLALPTDLRAMCVPVAIATT
jgi:hypothetical protein